MKAMTANQITFRVVFIKDFKFNKLKELRRVSDLYFVCLVPNGGFTSLIFCFSSHKDFISCLNLNIWVHLTCCFSIPD